MAGELNFDIISDNEGTDLLEQFYKVKEEGDDKNLDLTKKAEENADDKNKDDKSQQQDDTKDKPYKPSDNDLIELLKKTTEDDDDEDKNKDLDKDKTKTNQEGDNKNKSTKTPDGIFNILYQDFLDKGIVNEITDFDGTEEGFLKAYQESLFEKAEELKNQEIEDIFTANPKNAGIGKEFLSFLAKGGDPEDFIEIHSQKDYTEEDLKKESIQERVVREFLKVSGIPEDKIDARITKYKALESLEEEAVDAFEVLKKHKEKQKEELQTKTTQNREDLQKRVEAFNNDVVKTLNDNTELFGFHLGKDTKIKREITDYMFKPTVKTDSGQLVPEFAIARQKVASDPKWVLLQALALKNNMDFTKVVENAQTKVTKSLKEKLESADEIRKNKSEGRENNTGDNKASKMNLESLLSNTLGRY